MTDLAAIQELLERGLYHYGLGEVGKALQLWHEVLALDPKNELAREYIEIETGKSPDQAAPVVDEDIFDLDSEIQESAPAEPEEKTPAAEKFFIGQQMLLNERWSEAEQAFVDAHHLDPANPIYWAHAELARGRLLRETIDRAGGLHQIPQLTKDLKALAEMNFTQEEGFILSLINGEMSFEDIIAISPIPRGTTYRILLRLLTDGLIALRKA